MRILFAALFVVAAGSFADTAKADPYRWCAQYMGGKIAGATNCYFVTLEQCRAAASGLGGQCKPNPFYDGVPVDGQRAPRRAKTRS